MKLLFLCVLVCAALHSFVAEDTADDADRITSDNEEHRFLRHPKAKGGPHHPKAKGGPHHPSKGTEGGSSTPGPPNIIFVLADDLGYNDVGYMNTEVITPNLDTLASEGRYFTNNYVAPACSPSRHALLTGIYPYKSRMQHLVLQGASCSPTDLTYLPERLKGLGYVTAIAGKWHLGFCQSQCMPMSRGFDHQYGILNGHGDFFFHDFQGMYDFRDQEVTDWASNGTYVTNLLGDRAVSLIQSTDDPLFLYLSFTAVHTPLQVPEGYLDLYPDVAEPRKTYLGMATAMDDAIGNVVQALKDTGKWDNTLLIFSSDNGGEVGGASDNSPLRGCKASMWEGGTKVPGLVAGGLLGARHRKDDAKDDGIIHEVDWIPTILHFAGGDLSTVADLDGIDQYEMIMNGGPSARNELIYNIDMHEYAMYGQAAIRVQNFKLIWGHEGYCDGTGLGVEPFWLIPEQCALAGIECPESGGSEYQFTEDEEIAQYAIIAAKAFNKTDIHSGSVLLFNLDDDPNEQNDLSGKPLYAAKVLLLKQKLLNEINNNYVAPPPPVGYIPMTPEINPNGPNAMSAWGLNWCNNLDLTMP